MVGTAVCLFSAEQRMRDRIAASAREKLSQVDREAQMKLERKRKAAMFINLLKNKNNPEASGDAKQGNWLLIDIMLRLL